MPSSTQGSAMTDPTTAASAATVTQDVAEYVTAAGQVETKPGKPRSLWSDAWRDLRRRPLFLIAIAVITVLVVMSLFPGLFTSADPNLRDLSRSRQGPSAAAWFGYDVQGQDIYARVIYGARWSLLVGVSSSALTVLIGASLGILAGYLGGWSDGLLSRLAEIFFGLPFVLGAIVILSAFRSANVRNSLAIV